MREFINIVESTILTEKFHKGFVSFQGKTCEVFQNPSPKEYKECLAGNDQVRAFLVGDDILVWDVFSALHQMVRDELHLPADSIPLVIYGDLGEVCSAEVTDNSRNTVWWHNGEVHDVIQSHAYMSRHFLATRVGYYDEDIVGEWTGLDDEEELTEDVAWHGSPHKFDSFSTDHIGSGEGAQAYGWGLYFTETQAVGEYYKNVLRQSKVDDILRNVREKLNAQPPLGEAYGYLVNGASEEWVYNALAGKVGKIKAKMAVMRVMPIFKKREKLLKQHGGRLFQVDLPSSEDGYLLWDKPLTQQPAKVRAVIARHPLEAENGSDYYHGLQSELGSPKAASMTLARQGVVGVKYLDGDSRTGNGSSFNYVIFDAKFVKVTQVDPE